MILQNAASDRVIKKLDISNNNIGAQGLQAFCSVLVLKKDDCGLTELDIQNNNIPDKSLKALLALVFKNNQILEIKYSLVEPENIEAKKTFERKSQLMAPGMGIS